MRRAEGGPPRPPLGSLAASTGELEAVLARFDAVASRAWLTRRVSALVPARGGLAAGDGARLAARLQLQRASFELQGVPLARLGEQPFADAVRDYQICCLSRGRGLDAGNVVAVLPPGELVASVDVSTFQQLGLEEPARGAKQLRRKLLVGERRHVRIALGVSKTRAARAKRMGEAATSRWSSLVPASERCSLVAYYGREEEGLAAAAGGGGLGLLVDGGAPASLRRLDVPVTLRRLSLGAPGGDGQHIARPPVEALVAEQAPAGGGAAGGEAGGADGEMCEELLDWLGALQLGFDARFDGADAPETAEEAWLWTMGESLLGPQQVRHALGGCLEALDGGSGWFLLSAWGAEDAPVSHRGGAHGYDATGAHHVHVLGVRGPTGRRRGLLLEAANALDSAGV